MEPVSARLVWSIFVVLGRFSSVLLVAVVGAAVVQADVPGTADSPAARIDEILTQLQARSDGLKDIRCAVTFVDDDRINLSKGTKKGRVLFLITEPNPHFLIHFDRTEMDGVLGKQEWYLYDGQWFYQAVERVSQVTKQELAKPGEKIDLFDIERSPFPLPFGQKKETIQRNFDVTLAAPGADDPAETDHLVCIPKAESRMHRKYDRLDLFVRRDVHLPSRIIVTKHGGSEISTADFPDLSEKSINAGVKSGDFDKPPSWKKYKEVVEELVPTDESSP